MITPELKKAMDEYVDSIHKDWDFLHSLSSAAETAVKIKEKHPLVDRINIGWKASSLRGVLLHTIPEDFHGLLDILESLDSAGYECTKTDDYIEIGRRTYHCGKIILMAFPEGSKCKKVQVGVEPKYEFQCNQD